MDYIRFRFGDRAISRFRGARGAVVELLSLASDGTRVDFFRLRTSPPIGDGENRSKFFHFRFSGTAVSHAESEKLDSPAEASTAIFFAVV